MQPLAKSELQSSVRLVGVLVAVVLLTSPTAARPNGAPISACVHMIPGHRQYNTSMNTLDYEIEVNPKMGSSNGEVTVTVKGEFAGLLMQVREVGRTTIVGTWSTSDLPANTKTIKCTDDDDSVTHANTDTKMNPVFTWKAPSNNKGNVEVVATVAKSFQEWRSGIKSEQFKSTSSTITGASIVALLVVALAIVKINM